MPRTTAPSWTEAEDEWLREFYPLYQNWELAELKAQDGWPRDEQAIAATLGPKTCHNESEYPQMFFICSECGCAHKRNRAYVDMPRFCPNCSAKVVEE